MMRIPLLTIVVFALAALLPAQERRRPGPERTPTERAQSERAWREHREVLRGERRAGPRREMLIARLKQMRERIDQMLERRDGKAPMRTRGGERPGAARRELEKQRAGRGAGRGELRPGRPNVPPRGRAGQRGRGRGGEPAGRST